MSFVESLDLDITRALRQVDRIEAELTQAGQRFSVDLAQSLDRLGTGVRLDVEVDTSGVAQDITQAVRRADTEAEITADTTQARREVDRLGDSVERTAGRVSILRQALATVGAVEIARGIEAIADAGSSLTEQQSAAEVVFESAATSVRQFAEQAERIGIGTTDALRAASAFGQIAQQADLAGQAAADFATSLVERSADIASLRDLDISETLERLESGLIGETEPLRRLGILFSDLEVEAKGAELGLSGVGDELTQSEKVLARYQLIMEQSAIAQGNFALTSEGLANTQRRVRAELSNTLSAVGQRFESQFVDLAEAAGDELIPRLGELAEQSLPALIEAAQALTPLLGTALDLLTASAPALTALASIVDAIPEPLLAIGAGAIAIDRATLALGRFQQRALQSGSAVGGLVGGVRQLNAAMGQVGGLRTAAGLTAAIAGIGIVSQEVEGGVGALAGGIIKLADSFTGFGARRTERVAEGLRELVSGFDLNNLNDAAVAISVLREEVRRLEEQGVEPTFALGNVRAFLGDQDTPDRRERRDQINDLIEDLETQAQAEIDAGIATGRFTAEQVTASESLARRDGTQSLVIETLSLLRDAEREAQTEAERTRARYQAVADQFVGVAGQMALVEQAAPAVATALRDITLGQGGTDENFLDLALAIDEAGLSGEEMQAVANALGVSLEDLSSVVSIASGRFEDFLASAVGGLPTLADVFDAAGRSAEGAGDSTTRAVDRAGDALDNLRDRAREAQEALEEALSPPSARDLERAQLGVERALQRQVDVEARLAEARANANNTTGGNTLEDRQRAIADAELDLREATLGVADAQDRLVEVQQRGSESDERVIEARERVAEANEAVAEAAEDSQVRSSRAFQQVAQDAELSARSVIDALNEQTAGLADFRADLEAIRAAGFPDVAAVIAEQGIDVGDALADELRRAIESGDTAILDELREATEAFETEWSDTEEFFRTTLGPEMILTSGLIGSAIAESFGNNLDFEERLRIRAGLAASGLDEEGQAIAAVAAVEGETAAEAYAEALGTGMEQGAIDAAIEVGNALRTNTPTDAARVGGQAIVDALISGMETQVVFDIARIEGVSAAIAERAVDHMKEELGIESPSRKFMEIGAQSAEGFLVGFDDRFAAFNPDVDGAIEKLKAFNTDGGLALSAANRSEFTANLDDSRLAGLLERILDRVGPTFGSVSFPNSPDPGRDIELLARRFKGLQR